MNQRETGLKNIINSEVRSVSLEQSIKIEKNFHPFNYPVTLEPSVDNLNFIEWIADRSNKDQVISLLNDHGAVLFRGFNISTPELFKQVSASICGQLLDYNDPSSPRTLFSDKVYTSTDYTASESIRMHNELSYSFAYPSRILFYCKTPPDSRGETPIVKVDPVLRALEPHVYEKFKVEGVRYVRNMRQGLGLSWQQVYGTSNRLHVDQFLASQGIDFEWRSADHLYISWIKPAIIQHPVLKAQVWFNHAYFFHGSGYPKQLRDMVGSPDELPFNAYYGDGTPIDDETIRRIGEVYEENMVVFPWRQHDVLLLDNLRIAHGRRPYSGKREIMVSMGD